MKAHDLKELAVLIANQKIIDNKVIDYIIKKLNLADLRLFKKYLDQEISKKKLYIEVANDDESIKKTMADMFPDRQLEIAVNPTLGAGMYIIDNDNHYDLSVRARIEQIIEDLRN